ncbi:MAG: cell division protein FtsQ/DivIB [Planctomycetota bacterium]
MAKRKRTKQTKTRKISFKRRTSKKKSRRKINYYPSLMRILKIFAVACVSAAMGIGFVFFLREGFIWLDKYVKNNVPVWEEASTLKLMDVPPWVNETLQTKIQAAAAPRGALIPSEEAARLIQTNLSLTTAWLDKITVQSTHDSIKITGRWRRPLALVRSSLNKFYVDSDLVVLDYVPLPNLPVVRVEGLPLIIKTPPPGTIWQHDDLAAAVAVLKRLDRRDKDIEASQKPLLSEIGSIDMSNFEGRENASFPHIVLYAKDNTEIIWGAEVGKWQRHLESKDEEKLAKLYSYYKKHGTLLGGVTGVKYINLCDPRDNIPLPIDKY